MDRTTGMSRRNHFPALRDPRQQARVPSPLPEIMPLLPCATLAGADDVVEIQLRSHQHLAFRRREHRCHDASGEVIGAIDPDLFKSCFTSWVAGLREAEPDLVGIDGKTSHRTHACTKAWERGSN